MPKALVSALLGLMLTAAAREPASGNPALEPGMVHAGAERGLSAAPAEASDAQTAAPADSPVGPADRQFRRFALHAGLLALIAAGVITGIVLARRGRALPIREIPGLLAFDEAVARATEMGRPTLFTCGGMAEIRRLQVYASMPMLREVAGLSARLGNRLIVPVCFPEALPLHTNAIRDAYLEADALEEYRPDDIRYFPGAQFFFAMAAAGWMLQERPAACFYFGYWEGDALLFAETGQTIDALQIAGTDQLYQIPFFVAACDYTIIGEEFWAASAKLSREPGLLGSLGAQDIFKLALLAVIVLGCLLALHPAVAAWLDDVRTAFA
ncbi:MAG: DUF6754 domain-containing protein [Planctomycetota bacterium]